MGQAVPGAASQKAGRLSTAKLAGQPFPENIFVTGTNGANAETLEISSVRYHPPVTTPPPCSILLGTPRISF